MRKKHKMFTVEGEKSVRDTLDHFNVEAIICLENKTYDFIQVNTPVYSVSRNFLDKLSNFSNSPDIIAVYKYPESDSNIPSNLEQGLYVVIDGVQDPGNLGTIIRTCHWFGIRHIFASKDTVDVFNPKTIQSTMGSIAKVKVTYCDLIELFISNRNIPVYGLLLDGENIFKASLQKNGFLLFGNEGKGISKQLRDYVKYRLLIPPGNEDHSESLNVSVAAGITISLFKK